MAELDILRLDRGIIEGDITRVNSALLIGASPDGDKNAAKKPIHFAVENDAIQIVELLCEWGAKVNVPNPEEQDGSPLHMAVKKGFTSVAKCLLEKNADPNVKDGEGGFHHGFQVTVSLASRR
ncbi:myotrophin-like [Penaeus japonicus]|uniref:myotrophin-like n=1 Tax=Penaeus japonicus TaxID=27405 RepID=UPI001C712C76|nr:myotrophin-like [Penaeus japonicus]